MKTRHYSIKDKDLISQEIKDGKLIAIPTDTVYGLAASSNNSENYIKLVKAKGRPENKPFPLMVSNLEQIAAIAIIGERERHLIEKFMPGAVTFIFKRRPDVFEFLEGFDTIGIRMADDVWVQEVIEESGSPIWLPSANLSGLDTALNSDMVLEQLEGRIDGVVLGHSGAQESSSVFDLSKETITVLREGKLKLESILEEAME